MPKAEAAELLKSDLTTLYRCMSSESLYHVYQVEETDTLVGWTSDLKVPGGD